MEVKHDASYKKQRDFRLVQRALEEKDQNAFAELLNLYYEALYHHLLQKVHSPEDADDLTIESFGKAFRSLDQYSDVHSFSTWLFRIANNHFIDFYRKKNRLKEITRLQSINVEGDNASLELICREPDPEEKYISKEKFSQVRMVVNQLKPDYKEIIIMRFFEELSYEEIQKKTDLPMGTLKAKLYRARVLLHSMLRDQSADFS